MVLFALVWIVPLNNTNVNALNEVPAFYYANYKFINDWDEMWNVFDSIKSRDELNKSIPSSYYTELLTHFNNSFPYLTEEYKSTYNNCIIIAESLSNNGYSYADLESLMWNSCYKSLSQANTKMKSLYTVKAVGTASPSKWSAPLVVTFDARNSSDPSNETIPTDNFFWYYRDENWIDTPMWKWNVINYEFKEAGKFIVHLVVRSSNADKWIWDWEKNIEVVVAPKAANIVVYANTRKMSANSPLKIGISEWEKWVVFDGSTTMPTWWRKILSHRWTITNSSNGFSYSKSWEWAPWYITVKLEWNGEFKVTLSTKDNENNSVSETFSLFMSDPVTVIKQTPSKWTTSTTFTFDGSASYSITSKLNTYIWETFDENGDHYGSMEQWKKMTKVFNKPWNYLVKLTVTDAAAQQNVEIRDIYVESTTPIPQFSIGATNKWTYPSEFTLDASNSSDVDVLNWYDSLEYYRSFDTDKVSIISWDNKNEKIIVQFDETGKHTIKLTVTDQYWKSASVSKIIDVKSTLRPEIEAIPWAITRWKELLFKSTVNQPVINYVWNYWDKTNTNSQNAVNVTKIYAERWIYTVTLTVYDKEWNYNTVTEKVFIWETDYPIAAYRIKNSKWFFIQASETCKIQTNSWGYVTQDAYAIDRLENFNINPSISVNTQWNQNGLKKVFEPEAVFGSNSSMERSELNHKFSLTGCHYVDLAVMDTNVWKQDKTRIRFYVKNALPTVKNVTLSFPQYSDDSAIWFNYWADTTKTQFDCSWTNNLTIKVTAVSPTDSDGSISRLRFYYYNVDDPDRILEYKETWMSTPYVYFVIPRISWEYKFWVMVYDNDWWMVNSEDILWSNPSIYFPANCDSWDIPIVTLKTSAQNVQVWDTVTYSIISKISNNYEDFETDRTFYFDFTWDGIRDLVTKKDTATYTFMEPYDEWVVPMAAVEYRWKIWKRDWDRILVRNWIKPVLLYNIYKNTVIFRDLSVGALQQRQICFDTAQCESWNTKYRRTHIVTDIDTLTWGASTVITENDSFLQQYTEYWAHNVSIYLKSKYWISVQTWFTIKTTSNDNNWSIAQWINMISIPEVTVSNWNLEVFLSKVMKSTLLLYMSNETWETCYIDTDISTDSDWDGKRDNDVDVACNTLAKIVYEPSYESAIWRVYFMNGGRLVFKNFYVTFEWYILELWEEELNIYNDITILINGIEDINISNTDLKSSLDILRKNLNNRSTVSAMVITIRDQIDAWWIKIDSKQKDMLDSILNRLSNTDTIVSVWMNEYEKSRDEILAMLSFSSLEPDIKQLFSEFEDSLPDLDPESKAKSLQMIWDKIAIDSKKGASVDSWDMENVVNPQFCNIFTYYDILPYTNKCTSENTAVIQNFQEGANNQVLERSNSNEWGLPTWLKIIIIILVWWLLLMWWVIVFFSVKARLNSRAEEDEDE